MKIDRPKLIKHLKSGLVAAEGAESDFVTIFKSDARTALALLEPEETPHSIEITGEMEDFLKKQTAEERLSFICALVYDWDGFCSANNLGGLLNEVYSYASYPTKRYKNEHNEAEMF